MAKHRPTIKDIGKAAGLSPSSVTRALNDHPGISDQTKKRVRHLARQMKYSPNLLARSLVKQRSPLLGLLVYDFRNGFYPDITRSIQNTAEKLGYWIVQASTDDDPQKAKSLMNSMVNLGVEGIIYASVQLDDPMVEKLIDDKFPIVLAVRRLRVNKGYRVILDNVRGANLAVSHLISLRYTHIGMIGGPTHLSTSIDRANGYFQAMREHGITVFTELICNCTSFSIESGYFFTKKLLSCARSNCPDALFCHDDDLAFGAMTAIKEFNLSVPEDVAIVGFDDIKMSSHPRIELTTISHNVEEMGKLVVQILIEQIHGHWPTQQLTVLEPRLIVRKSCGFHDVGRSLKGGDR